MANFFSNKWVKIGLIAVVVFTIWCLFIRGLRMSINNATSTTFNVRVRDGLSVVFDKTFQWGGSFNEKIKSADITMTSDAASKIVTVSVKCDNGNSYWARYDYKNDKWTTGKI